MKNDDDCNIRCTYQCLFLNESKKWCNFYEDLILNDSGYNIRCKDCYKNEIKFNEYVVLNKLIETILSEN